MSRIHRLFLKAFTQLVQCINQFDDGCVYSDTEASWVCIVGRLTFVNVVVRVQVLIFTFLVTHQFQTDIGQNFVGVHVDGGTRTTTVNVYRELIHTFSVIQDFITPR